MKKNHEHENEKHGIRKIKKKRFFIEKPKTQQTKIAKQTKSSMLISSQQKMKIVSNKPNTKNSQNINIL